MRKNNRLNILTSALFATFLVAISITSDHRAAIAAEQASQEQHLPSAPIELVRSELIAYCNTWHSMDAAKLYEILPPELKRKITIEQLTAGYPRFYRLLKPGFTASDVAAAAISLQSASRIDSDGILELTGGFKIAGGKEVKFSIFLQPNGGSWKAVRINTTTITDNLVYRRQGVN